MLFARTIYTRRPALLCQLRPQCKSGLACRSVAQYLLSRRTVSSYSSQLVIDGTCYETDDWSNVPSTICDKVPRRLHLQHDHPVAITRRLIESCFPGYAHHNDLRPVVSVAQNFDSLGFPADHVGRSTTDTYYVNKSTVLRTHTSAHQVDTFRQNTSAGFTISADVYRRDAVDRSHYPAFHQMEGAMSWDRNAVPVGKSLADVIWADVEKLPKHNLVVEDPNPGSHAERNPLQASHSAEEAEAISVHLKRSLENVVVQVFSKVKEAANAQSGADTDTSEPLQVRWVEAYFPFTSPSWELEVFWSGEWLEVVGCGVVSQPLLDSAGVPSRSGWAFGVGLERIAMLLYNIPDIRLFWSKDNRFLEQFRADRPIRRFVPFSKYPAATRDLAFWLPCRTNSEKSDEHSHHEAGHTPLSPAGGFTMAQSQTKTPQHKNKAFHENDMTEIVRQICSDTVEDVKLVDDFINPKTGRQSMCFRIVYRSLENTLTKEQVSDMHQRIGQRLVDDWDVSLR